MDKLVKFLTPLYSPEEMSTEALIVIKVVKMVVAIMNSIMCIFFI